MQKQIGIIGTGRMAVRLAHLLLANGHRVVLGSRKPSRAHNLARALDSPACSGGSYGDAAEQAIVIPAAFIRDGLFEILEMLRRQLAGKLLIDIANPFNEDYTDFVLPWGTSAAEQLQLRFPANRIVGIFKNAGWETFDNPCFPEGSSDIYVVGDDAEAKREVTELFSRCDFRLVDAGRLVNARIVERMTLFAMELGGRMQYLPRIGWKLLGEPWVPGEKDAWAKTLAAV